MRKEACMLALNIDIIIMQVDLPCFLNHQN